MDIGIIVTIVIYALSTSIGAFIYIMNMRADIRLLQGKITEHINAYNGFKNDTTQTNREILSELKKISEIGIELRESRKENDRRFEQLEREIENMNTNIKLFYEKYSHIFNSK
jgi:peptidoglycan hydrolase CwlO-like protein